MINLFIAMAWAIVAWIYLSLVFEGIGLAVRRLFGFRSFSANDLMIAPWMGFSMGLVILQAWNLIFPVDRNAALLISTIGLAGLAWNGKELLSFIQQRRRLFITLGLLLLAALVFLSYQTTRPPYNYDSGRYHIPCIKWAYSYPVIPGIGLLFDGFASNQSFFLYAAMLNHGPFFEKYHHIASGLLLFWSISTSLCAIVRLYRQHQPMPHVNDIFNALLLVPILSKSIDTVYCSSPTSDVCIFLLGLAIASQFMSFLFSPTVGTLPLSENTPASPGKLPGYNEEPHYQVFYLFVLCAAGITVKLNFLPYTGITLLIVLILSTTRMIKTRTLRISRLLVPATAATAILFLWMARGVIMTGYPAYPAKVCAFPVEWKIPDRQINKTSLAIQAWARRPGPAYLTALNNFAWVKECIIRVLREPNVITPIVLGLTGLLIIVRNRNVYTSLPRSLWLVFLPHVVAILFFILSVPNPKFAEASIWALGAGLLALAISRLNGETIMLVCLASSAVMSANLVNPVDVCHEWINYTGSLRTCPMEVKVTDSGLNLYVPVAGDQCWNAPLPNTPYFNPKLRLRVKDDIRSGFVLSE